MQHRLFLHSALGAEWFAQRFGPTIAIDGKTHETRTIAFDHLIEDVGTVPAIEDWLAEMPNVRTRRIPHRLQTIHADRTAGAVERWGGSAADFQTIFDFLDSPARHTDDRRAVILSHNSFAIFVLEDIVGPLIRIGDRSIPTRSVAEDLVCARYGHIPFPTQVTGFRLKPWMRGSGVADALAQRSARP